MMRAVFILSLLLLGGSASASSPKVYDRLALLARNQDAWAAKRQLIRSARPDGTIDLSYFIIDHDPTTAALVEELVAKADRGTRVRVLVDYFMSDTQLPTLLFLDKHPRIEVRRFRPPTERLVHELRVQGVDPDLFIGGLMKTDQKLILASVAGSPLKAALEEALARSRSYRDVTPEERLASLDAPALLAIARKVGELAPLVQELKTFLRRTHHKLLVVDSRCFVLGGRNLSDEYHADLGDRLLETRNYPFQDTDLAGCAPDDEQQRSFDRLWNSALAAKLATTSPGFGTVAPITAAELRDRAARAAHIARHPLTATILPPSEGRLLENLPAGVVSPAGRGAHDITTAYLERIRGAKKRIDIVTAYFCVDTANKDRRLNELYRALVSAARDRGVQVTVYTNSITSTDLNMVNLAAYGRYRELAEAGVRVVELAPGQGSLHTKAAAFDDDYLLVGSYNMDPRSHLYDTNNLLELHDPSASGALTSPFRRERIEALRWLPADLDAIDVILRAKGREAALFRAVRELI
jgi:phosphatidylserine/phosphatidylglycerophosphate/cardiolipin synthase-like enzyme